MTQFLFTKRSAAQLHVGAVDRAPAIQDLVDRVVALAKLSPSEVTDLLETADGAEVTRLDVVELEGAAPESLLRSWDSIGHASPAPLSAVQYDRFLRGKHPVDSVELTVEPLELYGANVEVER
jgi:hypothetical protein